MHQKSAIFVTIGIFDKEFKFQTYVCNGCHDVLIMSINLINDIGSIFIKSKIFSANKL